MLDKNFPTPYAVVQLWPDAVRFELFNETACLINTPATFGKDNSDDGKFKDGFYKHWITDPENANTHTWLIAQASKSMWSNKTRYYEISLHKSTAELLNCECSEWLDVARDLVHPGIETVSLVAKNIAENI